MDRGTYGLCYLITLVVGVVLGIYGFMDVLREKQNKESNDAVVQRQLRGFGFLVLAQIVLLVGLALCFGATRGLTNVLGTLGL